MPFKIGRPTTNDTLTGAYDPSIGPGAIWRPSKEVMMKRANKGAGTEDGRYVTGTLLHPVKRTADARPNERPCMHHKDKAPAFFVTG